MFDFVLTLLPFLAALTTSVAQPVILTQPQSRTNVVGTDATFSVDRQPFAVSTGGQCKHNIGELQSARLAEGPCSFLSRPGEMHLASEDWDGWRNRCGRRPVSGA